MRNTVITKGLAAGSLFKLLFIGYGFSLGPIVIVMGVFAFFGHDTIFINREAIIGVEGLLASFVMAPLFALIFAAVNWLFVAFGQWFFSKFARIKIRYKSNYYQS